MKVKKLRKKPSYGCIFPGYKWCGPGCSGPGAPINEVDACCKAHDKCLKNGSKCKCDREFLNCLRSKVDLTNKKGRVSALMYGYMKIQTMFTCNRNY